MNSKIRAIDSIRARASKITAFIGDKNTFEIVDNEKPGYIYYNKDINKFRGFLRMKQTETKNFCGVL